MRATSGASNPNLNIGFKRMRGSYIALQWLEFSKKSRPSKYLSLGTLRTNEMKGRNLSTGALTTRDKHEAAVIWAQAFWPPETNTKQKTILTKA